MKRLRILSYNIHGGVDMWRRRDLRRVHALMERHDIDIGVFQEMETRPSRGGTAADIRILAGPSRPHHLPALTVTEDKGWYGNLIVSRYPILRGLTHDLETPKSLEPRNAVDALIDVPGGPIRIIGTHLSLRGGARYAELKRLVNLIARVEEAEKNPVILLGDLNEWRGWAAPLLRHLRRLMTPLSCGPSFPAFFPVLKLDRAWTDSPGHPATARTLKTLETRQLSDHLPVIVELG